MSRKAVFFTIVARNYLAYARVLMRSVGKHHPQSKRIIFLCDDYPDLVETDGVPVVAARMLGIADFDAMAFGYEVMEMATAIKPTCFLHLMAQNRDAAVIYLDPDILVMSPLTHVLEPLQADHDLVLTPHITAPLQDGRMPDDLTIMKSGVYNLGFVAMRRSQETMDLLRWWQARCRRDAVVDIPGHRFTDQRWMDLAPSFVGKTLILRHPGYNLAYWNLGQRSLYAEGGDLHANGEALRFVHFSGVNPADPAVFSKHQNRFTAGTIGLLRPLLDSYLAMLRAAGWEEDRGCAYAFGRFRGGRRIHSLMRASFKRHEQEGAADPFDGDGAAFDAAEPLLAAMGPPAISRVMYELWESRADLQRAFDIGQAEGRASYCDWFVDHGYAEAGLDERSRQAMNPAAPPAESAEEAEELLSESVPEPVWRAQIAAHFDGLSHQAGGWLAEAPEPSPGAGALPAIPRQLCLIWETREDLRRHFRNRSATEIDAFLFWAVTRGVEEHEVDIALIAPVVSAYLDETLDPAGEEGPPLTRLMSLAAPHYDGAFPEIMRDFPASAAARTALILWLRGPAARRYAWPDSLLAAIDHWGRTRARSLEGVSLPVSNLLYGLWDLRADLRAAFPLRTLEGQSEFLHWLVVQGLREAALPFSVLSEELRRFLAAPATEGQVPRLLYLLWAGDDQLRARIDLSLSADRAALRKAVESGEDDGWGARSWLNWLEPPSAVPVTRPSRAVPILVTGLLREFSGRGEDVRMTAAALSAVTLPHALLDRRSAALTTVEGQLWLDRRDGFAVNIVHLNADTALRDHLFLRRARVAGCHTIGYWAWELESLPPAWMHAFSFYDEIWASTRFAYEAFAKAGLRPVHHMPMPVSPPDILPALGRADFDLPQDSYLFFFSFDFRSFVARKNPEATITAFRQAFPEGSEKVGLVIKTLAAEGHAAEKERLQQLIGGDPRILIRNRMYSAAELASLVACCDSYVSLHRSEGFGRGPAEAMALGKPVIATGYSGTMDFMDDRTALLVPFSRVPVGDFEYPGWEGQFWADPDPAVAAAFMRAVFETPALGVKKGEAARRKMLAQYSPQVIGRRYAERLALLLPPQAEAAPKRDRPRSVRLRRREPVVAPS